MCGICGIVTDGPPPDLDLLQRMIGRLGHRGPDGSGWFRDRRAALGHARLAVVDVPGGAQPLCNEDGTVWVTFNGEIFNHVELRRELGALGHTFRTASDTEVVVHAWEEWGEGCFPRFNGQWALALWDCRAERLVLSRDRLGVRPLFFTRDRDRLVFASEVKALFADASVRRAFDPAGLGEVLTYWSTLAPRTVFEGVEQLEPGFFAVLDRDGFRKAAYWTASFPPRGQEPRQDARGNAEALRASIVEATRLRFLRSDVPVGAYLSGGIDSAVTAAVVSRFTDAPVHTFSLRFADPEYDEGPHQQQMAQELGTKHHEVVVSHADIAEVFPRVVRHAETPVLRAAPAPMLLLSELVRESGFKVVVTGEGADEVLGGYDIFREARTRLFRSRDPGSPKRARAVELLYPWMSRSPARAPAFARSFFDLNLDPEDPAVSHRPRWTTTAALATLLSRDLREEVVGALGDEVATRMPADSAGWDPLSRAQWLEMTTLLPGYVLSSQGDRMLMASSVEGRFPFLDPDVVELANALPARHKLFGLEEKYLLKRAFADLVPAEILHRPKQPYRAPDAASFFFSSRRPDWIDEVTSPEAVREAGVFDPVRVAALLGKCEARAGRGLGNSDNMRVLAVLSTQLTHRHLIAGDGGRVSERPPRRPDVAVDLVAAERSSR
jgi:asparagine synthase (glutamine-hydrolysing)